MYFYLHSNAILNIKMYSCISLCLSIIQIKNLQNLFTICIETPFGCHFKILWKKRNVIVAYISVGLINRTAKHTGRSDWKIFHNCPIRIEIITGSHIFILFLQRVVTLCLHFTPHYLGIKCQHVVKTI